MLSYTIDPASSQLLAFIIISILVILFDLPTLYPPSSEKAYILEIFMLHIHKRPWVTQASARVHAKVAREIVYPFRPALAVFSAAQLYARTKKWNLYGRFGPHFSVPRASAPTEFIPVVREARFPFLYFLKYHL